MALPKLMPMKGAPRGRFLPQNVRKLEAGTACFTASVAISEPSVPTATAGSTRGCDPASPLIAEERPALVRSYEALRSAVNR
jgi:hypothetical protein